MPWRRCRYTHKFGDEQRTTQTPLERSATILKIVGVVVMVFAPIAFVAVTLNGERAFGGDGAVLVAVFVSFGVLIAGYMHRVFGHLLLCIAQIEKNTRR